MGDYVSTVIEKIEAIYRKARDMKDFHDQVVTLVDGELRESFRNGLKAGARREKRYSNGSTGRKFSQGWKQVNGEKHKAEQAV